jgi:antitoxin component YwqK of YwqJK toxin-antitoxin module
VNRLLLFFIPVFIASHGALSQGVTRYTYHDKEKKNLKEVYHVKDTVRNILQGRYVSYFLNGTIESKGQFADNETTGVWEFFFETGNLKMRGILRHNSNYGLWEYFYESGKKSMEGMINGKNREGEWKTYYENGQLKEVGAYANNKRSGLWKMYYEDGTLKSEADYDDDFGSIKEYHHTGKIMSEGPRSGARNVGHWRFYSEDGAVQSEGDYSNGKKDGEWKNFFPNGKIASHGRYENDVPSGKWEYYFDNGNVSSTGNFNDGKKGGYWSVYNTDGTLKSETTYDEGSGEYREYYKNGKLKIKGKILNDKREGKWEFYYEDGKREGECEYVNGKGIYHGYFPNGNLQTKGTLEEDVKTGTWEIYENDGKLSGYYRPFYDDRKLGKEIAELAGKSKITKAATRKQRFMYFDQRFNEFKGVILEGNPILAFAGRIPLGVEFYLQERLGHAFEFVGIRDPFFKGDENIALGKRFSRGYSISIKQKFYNPISAGMWYFGHEIRFTNLGYFTNIPFPVIQNPNNFYTASAIEQRIEWGILLGYRIMQSNRAKGFTIDAFVSADFGYRGFNVDPNYGEFFSEYKQSNFSNSFHLGLNIGNVFSFK